MNPVRRALLTFGCLVPLPVLTALLYLASFTEFDGIPRGAFQTTLFVIYWVMLAVAIVTWITALVIVRRRSDIPSAARSRWFWRIFVFNLFSLPVFWWRLVRPAPTT